MGLRGSMKRYWSRRHYQRLDHQDGFSRRSQLRVTTLGGGTSGRRLWRLRLTPRVHLRLRSIRLPSPVKTLLARLRDLYVDAMLRISGSGGLLLGSANGFPSKKISGSRKDAVYFDSDVEKRVIFELYKALAASQRLSANY
ncbi:uncharacterized protein LOC116256466 [Nymphaea colorata]|uniref:uncharacterized protein LOC116256466 n=1 Tax=Nymphaea colorata TaxID=210225 RepID=UPI00129DF0F2|nr:uncharacterized protein LOC116256466 [Nymphaea colorata]